MTKTGKALLDKLTKDLENKLMSEGISSEEAVRRATAARDTFVSGLNDESLGDWILS